MGVRSGRGLQINTVYRTLLVRHRMRVLVEWCEREKETPVSNSWIPYAWLNDACKVEARDMCGPACAGHGQQRHRNPNRKHHVLADAQERKVRRGKQPHAEREQKTDLALMLAHSAIAWWGHGSFGARRPVLGRTAWDKTTYIHLRRRSAVVCRHVCRASHIHGCARMPSSRRRTNFWYVSLSGTAWNHGYAARSCTESCGTL